VVVQRQQPVAQRAADDLVHRVVAPDVLAYEQEFPGGAEEAGGVHAAGAPEARLAQAIGQRGEQRAIDQRAGRQHRRVHGDLVERALAADAARRGRVEAPRVRCPRRSADGSVSLEVPAAGRREARGSSSVTTGERWLPFAVTSPIWACSRRLSSTAGCSAPSS